MRLQHARVSLELHELARQPGPNLLLLHALYGSSMDWQDVPATWPGSVYALDFCGHGGSESLIAGAYTPELLVGDADCALARIGSAAVAGAGVGAYVALLLAGARSDLVPAALLFPGAGLSGGGTLPDFANPRARFTEFPRNEQSGGTPDPMLAALEQDVRPREYVEPFVRAARKLLLVEDGLVAPPWWLTVRHSTNAEILAADLGSALVRLAAGLR